MSKTFADFTKSEFNSWLLSNFSGFNIQTIKKENEAVFEIKIKEATDSVYIFSSISNNKIKKCKKDIKILLFDNISKRVYKKTIIQRENNDKATILLKIIASVNSFFRISKQIKRCHICNSPINKIKEKCININCKIKTKPVESRIITELVTDDNLINTSKYPYIKFPFKQFNRVQSTLFNVGYGTDANIILGTTTSSGKTVAAEMLIGETLNRGKKVIYVSPYKSLTQEKYDDWVIKFKKYKVCILTGDYSLKAGKAKELNESDIICMTAEMLDGRSRKVDTEKSSWIFEVDLIITDESHILATNRGHAVEVGLMRMAKLIPAARIMFLSATLPNIVDFMKWLTILNGKQTIAINSAWRATTLYWNFIEYNKRQAYYAKKEEQIGHVIDIVNSKPDQKFLIFVHDKNTGRKILSELGSIAKFHNADLDMKTRISIERDFQNKKGLRILIATSTLAWGRSLPARNVIIVDTYRGLSPVDEIDIIQMAGRAGRLGIDPDGHVYLICDNIELWKYRVEHPRDIISTLLNPDLLGFHYLAEIRLGEIKKHEDIKKWYSRSLAYVQECKGADGVSDDALVLLEKYKMLVSEGEFYDLTFLGKLSALLYYLPVDVFHLNTTLSRINDNSAWDNTILLSYAIGAIPSNQLNYVPTEFNKNVDDYNDIVQSIGTFSYVRKSVIAYKVWEYLEGQPKHFLINNVINDMNRTGEMINIMAGAYHWDCDPKLIVAQLKYGVNKKLAKLCLLPGIGRARAEKLDAMDISSYKDISKDNKELVFAAVGKKVGITIIKYVQNKLKIKK